jgi:hypothetical protein
MLQRTSLVPVKFKTLKNKHVKSGEWFDPYTGITFKNADDVDIDHLVPLYEVHIFCGSDWSQEKKRAYANDLSKTGPLRVVYRWTNRVPKNADDPSKYSPSWVPGRCRYLKDWVSIKQKWDYLWMIMRPLTSTNNLKLVISGLNIITIFGR